MSGQPGVRLAWHKPVVCVWGGCLTQVGCVNVRVADSPAACNQLRCAADEAVLVTDCTEEPKYAAECLGRCQVQQNAALMQQQQHPQAQRTASSPSPSRVVGSQWGVGSPRCWWWGRVPVLQQPQLVGSSSRSRVMPGTWTPSLHLQARCPRARTSCSKCVWWQQQVS